MTAKTLLIISGVVLSHIVLLVSFIFIGTLSSPDSTKDSTFNTSSSSEAVPLIDKAEAAPKAPVITTSSVTEIQSVPYSQTILEDSGMNKGVSYFKTSGRDGVNAITYELTLSDGSEVSRKIISNVTTTNPVDEVKVVGTYIYVEPVKEQSSNCDPNYTPCVPNVSYDLDCPDIGFQVIVIGRDVHRFDRDRDGYGCESYR